MNTERKWLGPDWRVLLEFGIEKGTFTCEHAEQICMLMLTLPERPDLKTAKQAVKAYLDKYNVASHYRDSFYRSLNEIWQRVAKSSKQLQQGRKLHLEWREEYDSTLDGYFSATDYRDIPGTPAQVLSRTLNWIKAGRWITKGEFFKFNRLALIDDRELHDELLDQIWSLLISIVKALPVHASSPDSFKLESTLLRAALATLTVAYNAHSGAIDIVRMRKAKPHPATAASS